MASRPLHVLNGLLARMNRDQRRLIFPHLEAVKLPQHRGLETRDRAIESVYFIETGLVSVVANEHDGNAIEIGVIGREGMTGIAVLMNAGRSSLDTLVQIPGSAYRLPADRLRSALDSNIGLNQLLAQYAYVFSIQASFTALANGRHNVEERLARWLLMAHDRSEGDRVSMTHALFAVMLGVRRPGVTTALNALHRRGLIVAGRGGVDIVNRKGLEKVANGIYGRPEAEYQRLFGDAPTED
jgi:CRP-like cAMP-binding protein